MSDLLISASMWGALIAWVLILRAGRVHARWQERDAAAEALAELNRIFGS